MIECRKSTAVQLERPVTTLPPLDQVYAYRDVQSMGPTRWVPRKIFCTARADHADAPGEAFVVKFCQGRDGAAAMISELICGGLFRAAGIEVLDPVSVHAS